MKTAIKRQHRAVKLMIATLFGLVLIVSGIALNARAVEPKSKYFLPNTKADINFESSTYSDVLTVSPVTNGISYLTKGEFSVVRAEGVDVSAFDASKLALDFWVFSEKPQAEFTGDNQFEISSNVADHDYNEYSWPASDVFHNQDYVVGKWNHVNLHVLNKAGSVLLSDLRYMRMYYLFGRNDYPILISEMKIVETELTGSNIIETKASGSAQFGDVTMPTGAKEADIVTLNLPKVTDITGEKLDESNIAVVVTGPNGFKSYGKTVTLDDGAGIYSVEYIATDALGKKVSLSKTFDVLALPTDAIAPKIIVFDNIPKDFMTENVFDMTKFINISDNKGKAKLDVSIEQIAPNGTVSSIFSGKGDAVIFNFAPTQKGVYTLNITAVDEVKNSTSRTIFLTTYNDANSENQISLFDTQKDSLDFLTGGYYKSRFVDARPSLGKGKSIEFAYEGGATSTTDNEAYRQEFALINNNPADLSSIDMRWACVRMNIFIDKQYANDNTWMPSNGTGYGNMGIGFSSRAGIFGVPRMEYPVNDLKLKKGWNDVTIKLGREFDGKVDLTSLSQIYLYTNFGSARRILINDIRIVESNYFAEGLLPVGATSSAKEYYLVSQTTDKVLASTAVVNNTEDYELKKAYYQNSPAVLPGLKITDYMGGVDYVDKPQITIKSPEGDIYESKYFKPETMGAYTIEYKCLDYFGQAITLNDTFEVLAPNSMPEIVIADFAELKFKKGDKVTLPVITATDGGGEAVEIRIKVVRPNGKELLKDDKGNYVPDMTGKYIVQIKATDVVGQSVKEEISFDVVTETKSVYTKERLSNGSILGIVLGSLGGVIILGAAVATLIICKKKKLLMFKPKQKNN